MPHATEHGGFTALGVSRSGPRPRSGAAPSHDAPPRPRLRLMAEGLWWLPSLLVFGAAAVAIAGGVVGFRRLGARRERAALDDGRALEVRAKGLIVQADTAVREAEREVAFADAQFGAVDRTPSARRARDGPGAAARGVPPAAAARRRRRPLGGRAPGVELADRRPLRVGAARHP